MNVENTSKSFQQKISFRHWPISNKLLVVLLLVSLVPLLVAITIVIHTSSKALTDETQDNMTLLGHSIALRFSSLLMDNQHLLRITANNPAIMAYLRGPLATARPIPPEEVNTAFSNLQKANPAIDTIGIYNHSGVVMAHTDNSLLGTNLSARDFISAALNGKTFISSIRRDLVNDRMGLNFSVPIIEKGEVIGAMAIHLDDKLFSDVFSQTLQSTTNQPQPHAISLYLTDPNGIIMAQSQGTDWLYHILGALSPAVTQRVAEEKPLGGVCPENQPNCAFGEKMTRQPQPLLALQALGDAMQAAFAAGQAGHARFCQPANPQAASAKQPCDGAWHVAAYAPVILPAGANHKESTQQFMVLAALPEQAFLGVVDRQNLFGFGIAGILAILAIVISLLLARLIAKPINRLAATAGEVESTQIFQHHMVADVTTLGDEIGHLARIFSKMVLALQARMAELRTIYQVGRSISSSIDLDETLNYVATSIQSVVPYDAMELSLLDEIQKRLVVQLAVGDRPNSGEPQRHAKDQGIFKRLLANDEGVLLADLSNTPEADELSMRTWADLQPKSYLGVSLQVKGKPIGVMELVSRQSNRFSIENLHLLESIAMQAAIVIQNAQEVRIRETQLKQKIQELNIEIDEIKRSKQVGEIVESEYFKQLRSRASQLRAERSKKTPLADG
jgi:HAMP domain-containing protein